MAYLIGLITKEEEEKLTKRGWQFEAVEDVADEIMSMNIPQEETPGISLRAVFVDSDMFSIMTGPDWDSCEH